MHPWYPMLSPAAHGRCKHENMENSDVASSNTQCVFYCRGCHEIFGDSLSIVRLSEELQSVSLQIIVEGGGFGSSKCCLSRSSNGRVIVLEKVFVIGGRKEILWTCDVVTDAVVITSNCETSIQGSDSGSTFQLLNCKSCNGCIGRYYKTTPQSLDVLRDIYTLDLCKIESYHLGSCTTSATNVHSLKDPLETLKEDIFKTQSMLLAVHDRVTKLESCLEEVDSSEELVRHENNGSKKKRKTK